MNPPRLAALRRVSPVLLLVAVAACGGGGGGGDATTAPGPLVLDLGLVASTTTTRGVVVLDNPDGATASVTAGAVVGPFTLDPLDLPMLIPARGSAPVHVIFTPPGVGAAAGSVTARLDLGAGVVRDRTILASATAEAVTLSVVTPTLAFGEVLSGTSRSLVARVRNASTVSPAPLAGVSLPAGGFAVQGAPLPTTLAPGQEVAITVMHTPTGIGAHGGTMTLGASSPGGPVTVALSGTTGGAVVTDYGTKTLDASLRTPVLTVDVPADAISLSLEGTIAAGSVAGLAELTGPSGKVYENTSGTGSYTWIPSDEVFSPSLPNTDKTAIQLEPGGGTYSFRFYRYSGSATSMGVRAIVERRPGTGTATIGKLDLDVWLAKVITPKAATAASDARLQSILTTVDSLLAQSGIHVGDVRYHDVTDATYDDVTNAEFGPMLKLTSAETDPRLNLFFVRTALGGGVLGVAATLAGPRRNGTSYSGVMSLYDGGYSASFVGTVAAHEIGHFLGLYHTCEQDGSHDFIDDTADCPATGTNAVCPTAGGGYLMHWQAVGGTTLTAGETHVILGHPCIDPAVPVGQPLLAASIGPRYQADMARLYETSPDTWCATCARLRTPKGR